MSQTLHAIEGRVIGPEGSAVAGAVLSIVESTVVLPELSQLSDNSGTFRMSLPTGTFTVEARSGGGDLRGQATFQLPGEAHVTLVLSP